MICRMRIIIIIDKNNLFCFFQWPTSTTTHTLYYKDKYNNLFETFIECLTCHSECPLGVCLSVLDSLGREDEWERACILRKSSANEKKLCIE